MLSPYYQENGITIYHGDCRDILPELEAVDLVLTDPPYNIGKNYGPATTDRLSEQDYATFLREIFQMLFDLLKDGYLYASHSDKGIYIFKPILEDLGFTFVQHLVWWGPNGYASQLHGLGWSFRHELILFLKKGVPLALDAHTPGVHFTTVIREVRPQSNFAEGRDHPTQKPVGLYKRILLRTPSSMILDPFLGSGTTLIAAKNLGRKAIGIEIEQKYCEIAVKRLAQGVLFEGE